MLGAGILVIISLSSIGAALLQEKDVAPRFVAFVVGTLFGQCLAAVQVHFFLRYHGMTWGDFLGFRRRRVLWMVLLGIATAVIVTPFGWAATYVSGKAIARLYEEPKQQTVVQVLETATDPGQRIIFALTAIIMAPLIEETMFRGILYPLLKQQGYRRLALWGTSLLFAAIHTNLLTFLPLFLFAVVLVMLYEWTDTMIAPITAHAAFNAINFTLLLKQSEIERWVDTFRDRV
jgi:membrane protease YdiL (CAAX protease family)